MSVTTNSNLTGIPFDSGQFPWKYSCRVATTANATLATAFAAGQVVDGVTLVAGDRILIKNQTDQTTNGIYVAQSSGAPIRATDADNGSELIGAVSVVREGSTNADTLWVCTNDTITIGSTNIVFSAVASGSYQPLSAVLTAFAAGALLTSAQGGTGNGFTKFSGAATSEKTYTLPNASANILTDNALVTVPQGGTGAGTLTGLVKGNGTSAMTAATAGTDYVAPGTATAFTKQQNFAAAAITSTSASIAWDVNVAQAATHTATENTTLANPTNLVAGGTYIFIFTQAASAKTLAFGNKYKWPGGTAPVVSTGNAAVDIFTFISDGTNLYGTVQQNFS